MDEESKVGQPYAHYDRKYDLVSVPNSNPGSTHERLTSKRRSRRMEDVRANHNQQRSGGKSSVRKDLKQVAERSPTRHNGGAHEFKSHPDLEIVAGQRVV